MFDLSGAFRLRDTALRAAMVSAHRLDIVPIVYGLTEQRRLELASAKVVACPGCYPTAAILALQPLVAASLLEPGIIIDAKSGVSGAGKTPTERTHFSECHGSVSAYGVFAHRHAAEIEQELGTAVTFVPHLVPLDRGIFETIYARLRPGMDEAAVAALDSGLCGFAVRPADRRGSAGDQTCRPHEFLRHRVAVQEQQLVMVACIDNLVKGAAGQAIQNFNVVFGFDEATGLN